MSTINGGVTDMHDDEPMYDEDDHRLVEVRDTPTKTVFRCDGSCGQDNCRYEDVLWK